MTNGCVRTNSSHPCHFWIAHLKIFMEYLEIFYTIMLKFLLKICQNVSFSNIFKSLNKYFFHLKHGLQFLKNIFAYFFIHYIDFKFIHMFP